MERSFKKHEKDKSKWELGMVAMVISKGMDRPTLMSRREEDVANPLFVAAKER